MRSTAIAIGAAVGCAALLAVAAPARAQDAAVAHAPEETWPRELVNRPLTLGAGMLEVTVPLDMNLSSDHVTEPIYLSPSVYYGVTRDITVGVRHFLGLCFKGAQKGCPHVYDDVSLDSIWRVWRGEDMELAVGAALDAAPIDPFTLTAEVRGIARWTGGPFALAVAPSVRVGLNQRGSADPRRFPIALPLATYSFGWVQDVIGTPDIVSIPATIEIQILPPLAFALGGALNGPIDPPSGGFTDWYTVPVGAAVIVSPNSALDLGASVTFTNLLGRERWPVTARGDSRGLQLFVAVRR